MKRGADERDESSDDGSVKRADECECPNASWSFVVNIFFRALLFIETAHLKANRSESCLDFQSFVYLCLEVVWR